MADRGARADDDFAVQHRPVLHIGSGFHHDRAEITPQDRAVPDRSAGFHRHVTDQGGCGCDPGVRMHVGRV
ncbi:MAG: hypothetical protein M3400_13855, partial [Actinomycetota bacterium]|nr:hypothetical protein [Actinomycetota bacterium]